MPRMGREGAEVALPELLSVDQRGPVGGEALASAEPGWELGTPPPNVLIVTKALQPAA